MLASVVIENENKRRGLTNEEAAQLADINIDEFISIAIGSREPDYEEGLKLASFYNIPLAVFFNTNKQPIYINTGTGTYHNSVNCYIGTYSGDDNLKEIVKDLITILQAGAAKVDDK